MTAAPGYIGSYRLLNLVHTSADCQIWQAFDDRNQLRVGIKTLRPELCKKRRPLAYLRQEYTVGRSFSDKRIIKIIEFATDRGRPYLAMEWFSAPNMKQIINQGVDKIAYLVPKIVEEAAEGLGHFHAAGWVHRDIKPHNFLVGDNGEVKLIDFALAARIPRGLARWFAGRVATQGTKSYISPEQIRGAVVDERADIYSFGCVIHELVAGIPPFTGSKASELLNKHLQAPPPSLETANREVGPRFAQLIRRTLAKEPSQRPASMADFLVELRMYPVFKHAPQPPEVPQS